MKVELIRYTEDCERLVAAAAKLCYSPVGIEQIEESLTDEKTAEFIGFLSELGHESPIEHISFTFGVEGVSRTLSHQLVRHRIASYSQQSQRYVRLDDFQYVVPPAIERDETAKKLYEEAMEASAKAYLALSKRIREHRIAELTAEGMSEKRAEKLAEKEAIEDARYVFPNACETKLVFTMNARALMNFFRLRCCQRAQWEIRNMAIEMLRAVKKVAPTIFAKAGPGCVKGPCPEGKMTCGKLPEVRRFFDTL